MIRLEHLVLYGRAASKPSSAWCTEDGRKGDVNKNEDRDGLAKVRKSSGATTMDRRQGEGHFVQFGWCGVETGKVYAALWGVEATEKKTTSRRRGLGVNKTSCSLHVER